MNEREESAVKWAMVTLAVVTLLTVTKCSETSERTNCLNSGRGYAADVCLHDIRRDAEVK